MPLNFILSFILSAVRANAEDKAQRNVESSQRALRQNDLARAEQESRAILRLDPDNADVHTPSAYCFIAPAN